MSTSAGARCKGYGKACHALFSSFPLAFKLEPHAGCQSRVSHDELTGQSSGLYKCLLQRGGALLLTRWSTTAPKSGITCFNKTHTFKVSFAQPKASPGLGRPDTPPAAHTAALSPLLFAHRARREFWTILGSGNLLGI